MKTNKTKTATDLAAMRNTVETLNALHRMKPIYVKLSASIDAITAEIQSANKKILSQIFATNAEIYSDLAETADAIAELSAMASKEFASKKAPKAKAKKVPAPRRLSACE